MSQLQEENTIFGYYFWAYFSLNIGNLICVSIGVGFLGIYCAKISNSFFKKMAYKIIHAPINLFFDTTPSGWILNRFSKDITKIDDEISEALFDCVDCTCAVLIMIYIISMFSIWLLLIIPIVGILLYFIIRYYI